MNDLTKNILVWLVIAIVMMAVFSNFSMTNNQSKDMSYSEFLNMVDAEQVSKVEIDGRTVTWETTSGEKYQTFAPPQDDKLIDDLLAHKVNVIATPPEKRSLLVEILINWIPFLLIIGLWIYIMRQMQGGGGRGGAM
ncbi:MAG TPA: ATP-dependent metalloprotease, partial [Thiothrix sp.]|nr:ATP-dependent metalloprotease [Thiothrix sp.]